MASENWNSAEGFTKATDSVLKELVPKAAEAGVKAGEVKKKIETSATKTAKDAVKMANQAKKNRKEDN